MSTARASAARMPTLRAQHVTLTPRSTLLGAIAGTTVLLLAGYLDLWRGGTELAAAALTLAYVAGVPISLWLYGRTDAARTAPAAADPPAWSTAAAVFVAVLALYVWSLAPTTAMWDASEYIAAAKVLGIPHPPGNPMFVLLAHAFAELPFPLSYAGRVNLLAATTSALSAALWCLVAHRALRGWSLPPWPRRVAAAAAAWAGATCFTVWNQSVVNEKVYTVAMLGLAASAWCALSWRDAQPTSRRATAFLLIVAYLCGLGYANHPAGFLPLPAMALFVLWQRPSTVLRWRLVGGAAACVALGLTPFLFQPIRAAYHPAINVGEPTACTGAPQLACTFSADTFARVMSNVSREQYGGHAVAERQAPLGAQVGMWWWYFRWQLLRDAANARPATQQALAVLALALGLLGGVTHFRRDRSSFAFFGPLVCTLTPALIVYLNFKYGASQSPELGDTVIREVRDRDYFFLWSFATWSVWMVLGLTTIWQWLAQRLAAFRSPAFAWRASAVVMLAALVPLMGNWHSAPRRGETFTAQWARDLLDSVGPNGILVTNGDNDSFPVWYAQLVEGVRPDVMLAIVPYLNTDWFARHLVPNAAELPPGLALSAPVRFDHAGIHATIPAGTLMRDQLVVLQLIKNEFPKRPVHFSIGPYAQAIGLGPYVVTHGLTQRLVVSPAAANPAFVSLGGIMVDVAASDSLWSHYSGPAALLAQSQWIDRPSISIPYAYAMTGQLVGYGRMARGDSAGGAAALRQVDTIARLIGLTQ
jgi:hypothetical protein